MESLVQDQAQSQALPKCKRHCWHTMHQLNLKTPQVDNMDMDATLTMHKRNIKTWDNLWDKAKNTWYSQERILLPYTI